MGVHKGFTLIEVLVALFIMSIGFLALSQMQYLSFRQSQLAHSGTTATNMIQAFSESDLSAVRNINKLNQNLVNKLSSGTSDIRRDLEYCKNNENCDACPCDPFLTITSQPDTNNTLRNCIVLDSTIPATKKGECDSTPGEYFLTRTITVDIDNNSNPVERNYKLAYTVKNQNQQSKSPLDLGSSLATQFIEINAHVDSTILATVGGNFSRILVIPNIP